MKKLSLLVALGLFTFGSATMVKAEESEVTLPADDASVGVESIEETTSEINYDDEAIMDRADLDGNGEISDEEKAAFEAGFEAENTEVEEVK